MTNSEAMTSSTRSFAYSYRLVKKCFVKICETSKCHNFLIFQPIFIRFSLFCSENFTLSSEIMLNLFRSSPLNIVNFYVQSQWRVVLLWYHSFWQSSIQRGRHTKLCIISSLKRIIQICSKFAVGFLKLLSTHPIHIVVWGNFPFKCSHYPGIIHISYKTIMILNGHTMKNCNVNVVKRKKYTETLFVKQNDAWAIIS